MARQCRASEGALGDWRPFVVASLESVVNFDLGNSIAVLERTPRVAEALLSGIPDAWTTGNEGPDTWSPFDNVGHLIHCELANWMPRVHIILSESDSANRRFDTFDRHIDPRKGRTVSELLAEFRQLREQSLSDLRVLNLTEAQLLLTGEHPEFGSVTLEQLLATWVAHDLGHIAQITRVMAKQYRDAVGPWEAYLPVLRR